MRDLMRTVRFHPYRKGMGPTFTLKMYDLGGVGFGPRTVGYELIQHGPGRRGRIIFHGPGRRGHIIFSGDDFRPGASMGIDSDASVEGLMGFLTQRPGDTDDEYFADYTPEQIEFAEQHAEALSAEVDYRFGEGARSK